MKFLPLRKGGGAEKVLAILKGGGGAQQVLGLFLRGSLKFWPYCRGGALSFHSLKGGGARNVLPCLEGGGAKSFGPAIFPFCSPPLPVINDQSLSSKHVAVKIVLLSKAWTYIQKIQLIILREKSNHKRDIIHKD